jgi:hypothetical protein
LKRGDVFCVVCLCLCLCVSDGMDAYLILSYLLLQLDFSTKLCFSTATTFLAVNLLDRFFSTTFMLQHQLNQQQQQQQRDGASNAGGREERRITRSSSSHSSYPSYPSYRGDFECVPPQHLMRLPPMCGERPQQQQAAEEEEEEGGEEEEEEEEEEKEEEFLPPPTDTPYDMLLLLNLATAAARVCFCTIVVTATAF